MSELDALIFSIGSGQGFHLLGSTIIVQTARTVKVIWHFFLFRIAAIFGVVCWMDTSQVAVQIKVGITINELAAAGILKSWIMLCYEFTYWH